MLFEVRSLECLAQLENLGIYCVFYLKRELVGEHEN
jgi:hypothetical protein